MRLAPLTLVLAGCAGSAVVSEPVAPQPSPPPPAATPRIEPLPHGEPISQIGAHQPEESPELAVPDGTPAFVVTRIEANGPATGLVRERWRLAEDGSRRVARLVLEKEEEPGKWVAIGHAGWIGRAEKGGAIAFRLVDRQGPLQWAPDHVDATCIPTRACTEEKPALKIPARKCDVTFADTVESVILTSHELEGTVTDTCAAPKVVTPSPPSMRRGRRREIDY